MTLGVEGVGRRSGAVMDRVDPERADETSDRRLIIGSGDDRPIDPTRALSNAPDDELGLLAGAMAWMCDPLVIQRYAQSLLRDMQVTLQQQGVEIQSERAEAAAKERAAALLESIAKANEAEAWGIFAQVAVRVAAVLTAVACTIAGAFTGGAGVALAVGIIVVAFGADLGLMLDECGVDSDVTNAIGIGASIVGTACTLGGTAAGTASAAASQSAAIAAESAAQVAAQTAEKVARALEIACRVSAGAATIGRGALTHQSDEAAASSESADFEATQANDTVEEHIEAAVEFMQSYRRVVARLTRAADARDEARRIATRRFA